MPFLYAYRDHFPALALADGMRYVQTSAAPGSVVTIWLKRRTEYQQKRMKEPYPGIYTHGEILFPGESLCYYITVRENEIEKLCTSGTLACDLAEDPTEGESRYALTSRLIRAKTQNDRDTIRETLGLLYKNEFLSEKLFPLPEDT